MILIQRHEHPSAAELEGLLAGRHTPSPGGRRNQRGTPGDKVSWPPRVGVAAHHQANAVLRLLFGRAPEQEHIE